MPGQGFGVSGCQMSQWARWVPVWGWSSTAGETGPRKPCQYTAPVTVEPAGAFINAVWSASGASVFLGPYASAKGATPLKSNAMVMTKGLGTWMARTATAARHGPPWSPHLGEPLLLYPPAPSLCTHLPPPP